MPLNCLHARRAAAVIRLQVNKTDRSDARGLAQLVRSGWDEPVPTKSMAGHRLRTILVAPQQVVGTCTALVNGIRDLAKTFGIIVAPGKGATFDRAVRTKLPDDPLVRAAAERLKQAAAPNVTALRVASQKRIFKRVREWRIFTMIETACLMKARRCIQA
nr:transposase [Paracoccus saliphilus]